MLGKKIIFDPERCINCGICEYYCSLHLEGAVNPSKSAIRIIKWPEFGIWVPMSCQHCFEPICKAACPTRAIYEDPETGGILIDSDLCVGCGLCVSLCPFGGIRIAVDKKNMIKCDLCKEEPEPLCVKFCPRSALQYVPAAEVYVRKMRLAAEKLKELVTKFVTAPSTYYKG